MSNTIKICRLSGLPVNPEDLAKYDAEFRAGYDAAEAARATKLHEDGTPDLRALDMLGLQTDLAQLEETLKAKYPVIGEMAFPETEQAWVDLLQSHGGVPLMLALSSADATKLILVIRDSEIG